MPNSELQFKNGNPGAVKYGNFINYYDFNPPSNRINLLPPDIWTTTFETTENSTKNTFVALDIGCNAGNLTHELWTFLQNHLPVGVEIKILAVDIDPLLIKRANEHYSNENITFESTDCTTNDFITLTNNYLKYLNKTRFNAVFCFSTTMWIHLNYGDLGLQQFLTRISQMCDVFVVEPQPWKCYTSAVKRMKGITEFSHFKDLKLRLNVVQDIELFITNKLGMTKVFESEKTEWKRVIFCFKNS